MPRTAKATLDSTGKLKVELDGYTLSLSASGCTAETDTLSVCNEAVELDVRSAEGSTGQVIALDSVYVNSEHTAYRGPLTQGYQENGYTFVLSDIDGDGADDLMVWTGKEGSYGGASCDIYLFDRSAGKYVHDQALSDLTIGTTAPFAIEDGKLKTSSVDGAGLRVFETYLMESKEPKLIERVTEETVEGSDPPKTKIERLIDGQMKEVNDAAAGQ